MKRSLALAALALVVVVALHHQGSRSSNATVLRRLLVSDMTAPSEDAPQGVPASFDWSMHPRAGHLTSLARFDAFTGWGQLYACAGAASTPRNRVALASLQTWVLMRGRATWHTIQATSDIQGAAFPESYVGSPVSALSLDSTATGTSVLMRPGYNFHFWPAAGRAILRASDVRAIVVTVMARLLPTGSHPPTAPCLVLSVGGDMWTSQSAVPDEFHDSGDVGIGRFKRVQSSWRLFTMTTASRDLLQRYSLPLRTQPGEAR